MTTRTSKEIVDQTEELARKIAEIMGYKIVRTGRMIFSRNPRVQMCWQMACAAQEILTYTDPEDAFSDLDEAEPLYDTVSDAHSSVAEGI